MKIIFYFTILSLLWSCSASKMSKQERLQQFTPSETTYQEATDSTILFGNVTREDSKNPMIFASVALYKNGVLIAGAETDWDGNYEFHSLYAGVYNLEVSYVGFPLMRITKVIVKGGFKTNVDIELRGGVDIPFCGLLYYEVPLVEQDNTTSGQTLTADQIRRRRSSN